MYNFDGSWRNITKSLFFFFWGDKFLGVQPVGAKIFTWPFLCVVVVSLFFFFTKMLFTPLSKPFVMVVRGHNESRIADINNALAKRVGFGKHFSRWGLNTVKVNCG